MSSLYFGGWVVSSHGRDPQLSPHPPGMVPPPTPYRLPGGYRSAVGAGTGLLAPWGERPLPVFHPSVESVLWREG